MIFLPDEVEDFDVIVRNARKKLEIPVEPAMPCVTRKRFPSAKALNQKVAVSKVVRERPLALSEGRLSLRKRERQKEAFDSQKVSSQRTRSFA